MKRREFLRNSTIGALGLGCLSPQLAQAYSDDRRAPIEPAKPAKNIIFMVSDGMSAGTLQMTDLLARRKYGRSSHWIRLYEEQRIRRALMDMRSADSLVTDSAAASSSWGGGVRVKNGRLNVGSDDQAYQPILQKFKDLGKAVGCVTTVPITHATPAGFCITDKSRSDQAKLAEKYLPLRFDVMLGGGLEYFTAEGRKDNIDLLAEFRQAGYGVAQTHAQLKKLQSSDSPILGVFHKAGLPFALDHAQDEQALRNVPSLADMTQFAIDRLKNQPEGFVIQVEGGKVDWAAHANDAAALLYDQLAFDDAIGVALEFAEQNNDTLLILTTDHGNANPGIILQDKVNQKFERVFDFRQTNEWILRGMHETPSSNALVERVEHALGFAIADDEAQSLIKRFNALNNEEQKDNYKLPFEYFGTIVAKYTAIGWAGTNHSADYVELAMFGPGSEMLKPFLLNTELHNFMLQATSANAPLVK
ncbi:MAG TPA: alkaline phosphatase [Pirellulaceae bacterium]|nr:alkaline phosphatase [Pirellulaceae bacterium]HMO92550.1 alkaline phosphatase [Pirellulaceae bacterium]HMP68968.1 alkaline phosphatase [Pirellulaceae bacterium]